MKYYFLIINILTLLLFGLDKLLAIFKKRRISEKTLFLLSLLGGCFFEYFGMYLFNHKIKKLKFHIFNIFFIIFYSLFIWYNFYSR